MSFVEGIYEALGRAVFAREWFAALSAPSKPLNELDKSGHTHTARVRCVLGPNSEGKSTTIKILLDLAKADNSHATIGGTRDREMADPACSVGVVLEPNEFHPRRSGRHGGSTTMALRGQMISHPSDGAGERHAGDALLVLPPRRR